ncbi:GIY-YIG nuclease family protein [Candidatus Beckwithbacteria bacterium]|nr:GIY-YIG nuclease family protein [Candidatus Beckwithbacteria bacterium]
MVIIQSIFTKIQNAPQTPGIYIFKNQTGEVLYIGKAINLKKRLLYYAKSEEDLTPKTANFLAQARKLEYVIVDSDLEAILLEINLIRTLKPKYNITSKDDKRPLYVQITNDEIPLVKTARMEVKGQGEFIGPFPSAQKLKSILKHLRKIFPYHSASLRSKKSNLYIDLGLAPNLLQNQNAKLLNKNKKQYQKDLRRLRLFLKGKIKKVIQILEKEMKEKALKQEYEKAQELKQQIEAIQDLLLPSPQIGQYLTNYSLKLELAKSQLKNLSQFLGIDEIYRIEGYDIANTAGTNATASMVVFEKGLPNTSQYRHFKIRKLDKPNDPLMMAQALQRRFTHPEWAMPDLILLDGGKGQLSVVLKNLLKLNIPIIGLTKKEEKIIIPDNHKFKTITPPFDAPYLLLLRAVRDEAHRFATTYHKKVREKKMIKN